MTELRAFDDALLALIRDGSADTAWLERLLTTKVPLADAASVFDEGAGAVEAVLGLAGGGGPGEAGFMGVDLELEFEEFAFGAPDPVLHVRLTTNHNPQLKWNGAPAQTRSTVSRTGAGRTAGDASGAGSDGVAGEERSDGGAQARRPRQGLTREEEKT